MELKNVEKYYLAIKPDEEIIAYFPIVFKEEKRAMQWCDENPDYKYTECAAEQ